MDEIARIDYGNNEYIVYWDSEEHRPRIQMDFDFRPMNPHCSVQQSLEDVFGEKKKIGDLVVNRHYPGLPSEFAMVRDSTWKQLMDHGMYVTFRVYKLD
jgi:hypothetical protein